MYPAVADLLKRSLNEWSLSVSKSVFGADYSKGEVLLSDRKMKDKTEKLRGQRREEWREEIKLS
jgi:hypothetical protein